MNTLTFAALFLVLASAILLYGLSYDTRHIEAKVRSAEREAERIRAEIAILKAERAYLARPERIEPAARSLGLRPIERRQVMDDGTRAVADITPKQPAPAEASAHP